MKPYHIKNYLLHLLSHPYYNLEESNYILI